MRDYWYTGFVCFGFVMIAAGCSSGSSSNTAASGCAAGQISSANYGCVAACGDGVSQGVINGVCTNVATTSTTGSCSVCQSGGGMIGFLVTNQASGLPSCVPASQGMYYGCAATSNGYGNYPGYSNYPGYGYGGGGGYVPPTS
jgi:hypothetical protein